MKVIKVCGDPHCESVYHNTPKEKTKCKMCENRLIEINKKTYEKKYRYWYFQYDYENEEYVHIKETYQIDLFEN